MHGSAQMQTRLDNSFALVADLSSSRSYRWRQQNRSKPTSRCSAKTLTFGSARYAAMCIGGAANLRDACLTYLRGSDAVHEAFAVDEGVINDGNSIGLLP